MTKKSRQKLKYLENEKSFLGEIKKHFSSFLNSFQLPKIISDLRVRLFYAAYLGKCSVHFTQLFSSLFKEYL